MEHLCPTKLFAFLVLLPNHATQSVDDEDQDFAAITKDGGQKANDGKLSGSHSSSKSNSVNLALYAYGALTAVIGLAMIGLAIIIVLQMKRYKRYELKAGRDADNQPRQTSKSFPDPEAQPEQVGQPPPTAAYNIQVPASLLRRKYSVDPKERQRLKEEKRRQKEEKRRRNREEKKRKQMEKEERKRLARMLKRRSSDTRSSASYASSTGSSATASKASKSSVSSLVSKVPTILRNAASAIGGSIHRKESESGKAYIIKRGDKAYVIQSPDGHSQVYDQSMLSTTSTTSLGSTAVGSESTTAMGSVAAYAAKVQDKFGVEQRSFYRSAAAGNDLTLRQTQNTDLAFGALGSIG